jgi:hypothetical protein
MHPLRPLSTYPAATLHAARAAIAALLRYQDMLPTNLYVQLDLLHGDISEALQPSPRPAPAFTPHPATPPRPLPSHGTVTLPQAPRRPSAPRDNPPPERHPQ